LPVLEVERDAPQFLRPPQIAALLLAADAHDAETFKSTRAEEHGVRLTVAPPARSPYLRPRSPGCSLVSTEQETHE